MNKLEMTKKIAELILGKKWTSKKAWKEAGIRVGLGLAALIGLDLVFDGSWPKGDKLPSLEVSLWPIILFCIAFLAMCIWMLTLHDDDAKEIYTKYLKKRHWHAVQGAAFLIGMYGIWTYGPKAILQVLEFFTKYVTGSGAWTLLILIAIVAGLILRKLGHKLFDALDKMDAAGN